MVGRTSPPGARPFPDAGRVRFTIPRWSLAVITLIAAIALLWAILGKPILQAVIQGLVVGSIYVLGASGLSLTYGIKKFANFAHGDLMTVGAYAAFTMNIVLGQNILVGFAFAIVTVALLGILLELSIFRRLEGRGPVSALIASVGVSLVLQNVLSAIFTTNVLYLGVNLPPDVPLGATGLSFNVVKGGVTLAVSAGFIVFLHVMLTYTTLGKAMRACADDLDLARTSGINTRNVILWTWIISGAFAAVAGVLLAIIVNVFPLLGFFVLLFIFAAVIIGGIGSPYGAMIGGLIIGIVQKVSNVVFGVTQNVPIPTIIIPATVAVAVGAMGTLAISESTLSRIHLTTSRASLVIRLGFAFLFAAGIAGWVAGIVLRPPPLGVFRIEGGAEYEPVGAFIVMIVVLLFLPEGLMGVRRHSMGGRFAGLRVVRRSTEVKEPG